MDSRLMHVPDMYTLYSEPATLLAVVSRSSGRFSLQKWSCGREGIYAYAEMIWRLAVLMYATPNFSENSRQAFGHSRRSPPPSAAASVRAKHSLRPTAAAVDSDYEGRARGHEHARLAAVPCDDRVDVNASPVDLSLRYGDVRAPVSTGLLVRLDNAALHPGAPRSDVSGLSAVHTTAAPA